MQLVPERRYLIEAGWSFLIIKIGLQDFSETENDNNLRCNKQTLQN